MCLFVFFLQQSDPKSKQLPQHYYQLLQRPGPTACGGPNKSDSMNAISNSRNDAFLLNSVQSLANPSIVKSTLLPEQNSNITYDMDIPNLPRRGSLPLPLLSTFLKPLPPPFGKSARRPSTGYLEPLREQGVAFQTIDSKEDIIWREVKSCFILSIFLSCFSAC